MTECPECGVPVRVDRLEKHRKKVHRGREKLPNFRSGFESTHQSLVKTNNAGQDVKASFSRDSYRKAVAKRRKPARILSKRTIWRKCPYCEEVYSTSEIKGHVSCCSSKVKPSPSSKIKARREKPKTRSSASVIKRKPTPKDRITQPKPPITKKYIIDEHGVLQDYATWWKNQNLGENILDVKPAQAKRPGNVSTKKFYSSKSRDTHCPECGVRLKVNNLGKHLRKVHQK